MRTKPALGEARGGQREVRIATERIPIQSGRPIERFGRSQRAFALSHLVFSLQKQVVRFRVAGGGKSQRRGFARRKLRAQRVRDLLGDFTLHIKNVFQLAVVALRPEVGIRPGIDSCTSPHPLRPFGRSLQPAETPILALRISSPACFIFCG